MAHFSPPSWAYSFSSCNQDLLTIELSPWTDDGWINWKRSEGQIMHMDFVCDRENTCVCLVVGLLCWPVRKAVLTWNSTICYQLRWFLGIITTVLGYDYLLIVKKCSNFQYIHLYFIYLFKFTYNVSCHISLIVFV